MARPSVAPYGWGHLALCLLACGPGTPSSDAGSSGGRILLDGPTYERFHPLGETVELRVEVRDEGGGVATDYRARWEVRRTDDGRGGFTQASASPEAGVEVLTLTAAEPLEVEAYLFVEGLCPMCGNASSPTATVTFWGGPAERIVVAARSISLAVGEVRPFAAYAVNDADVSHHAVSYAIDDAGVASLEGSVLTGLAVGTATLTLTAEGTTRAIAVEVVDAPLAAPADGHYPLFEGTVRADNTDPRLYVAPMREERMAVDSRGWPATTLLPFEGTGVYRQPMLVARWTGTGFGYERLEAAHDGAHGARVAFDEDDRLFVVYQTGFPPRLHLASAERGSLAWTDVELTTGATAGEDPQVPGRRASDPLARSFLPRPGGGVTLAWDYVSDVPCHRVIWIARVAGDGTVEEPERLRYVEACRATEPEPWTWLYLVPGSEPAGWPDVLLWRREARVLDQLTRNAANDWTTSELLPARYEDVAHPDEVRVFDLTVVRPSAAGEPTVLAWRSYPPGGSGNYHWVRTLDELRAPVELPLSSPLRPPGSSRDSFFGAHAAGQIFLWNAEAAPIGRVDRYRHFFHDDPVFPAYGDEGAPGEPHAVAGRLDRLHVVLTEDDRTDYAVATPPVQASLDATVSEGQRVEDSARQGPARSALGIDADGTRWLATEATTFPTSVGYYLSGWPEHDNPRGGVFRATASGAFARVGDSFASGESAIARTGGVWLGGRVTTGGVGTTIHASADGGTWAPIHALSAATSSDLTGVLVHSTGPAFAVGWESSTLLAVRLSTPTAGATVTDLMASASPISGSFLRREEISLFEAIDGDVVLITRRGGVSVNRWSVAGALRSESVHPPPSASLDAATGYELSNGDLIVFDHIPGATGITLRAHVSDDAFATYESAMVGPDDAVVGLPVRPSGSATGASRSPTPRTRATEVSGSRS